MSKLKVKNSKMKILFNNHYLKRKMCGIGRYARQINSMLLSNNIYVVGNSPLTFFYQDGKVIKFARFLAINLYESIRPIFYLFFNKNTIHISPSYAVPYSFGNRKTIVVIHDLAFLEYPKSYATLEKIYFKINLFFIKYSKCHIVTPSVYVKESLMNIYRINEKRITVISPYAETTFSSMKESINYLNSKYMIPSFKNIDNLDGYYCLLLSNAHPRKNIENTVNAYMESSFYKNGVPLLVVGTFEREMSFDSELIVTISNVSEEELSMLYENAVCVLLFSYSEGFGFPIVEAAQFNVPCLTSNVTSLSEFSKMNMASNPILTKNEIILELNKFIDNMTYRELLLNNCKDIKNEYIKEKFEQSWLQLIDKIKEDRS